MRADSYSGTEARSSAGRLSHFTLLLTSFLVIAGFFLPWFPDFSHQLISGALLGTGHVFDVYNYYAQIPLETFWLLWFIPLVAIALGGMALAAILRPQVRLPRSWPVWILLPLIGLALLLALPFPLTLTSKLAWGLSHLYGYWITLGGCVLLLLSGWVYHQRTEAVANAAQEDKPALPSRRKMLVGVSSAVGVALLFGAAFYLWRFVRERTPLYSRSLPGDLLNTLAWSPDGRRLAVGGLQSVQTWDALTGKPLHTFASTVLNESFRELAWSPDGRYLAAGGLITETVGMQIWDSTTGKVIFTAKDTSGVFSWFPGSQVVVFSNADFSTPLHAWDITTNTKVRKYSLGGLPNRDYHAVACSPNGQYIAAAGEIFLDTGKNPVKSGSGWTWGVDVWDAQSGQLLFSHQQDVNGGGISWSPDSKRLACPSFTTGVLILDVPSGHLVLRYGGATFSLRAAWSPDGRRIACDAGDAVLVWNAATGETEFVYLGHTDWIAAIRWSPDGSYIASAQQTSLQVWQP